MLCLRLEVKNNYYREILTQTGGMSLGRNYFQLQRLSFLFDCRKIDRPRISDTLAQTRSWKKLAAQNSDSDRGSVSREKLFPTATS